MTITTEEYINVPRRLAELGAQAPVRLALLPSNLERAESPAEFRVQSEAATVKTLLRQANIAYEEIESSGHRPAYVQNNAIEWIGPLIFVSATLLSEHPEHVDQLIKMVSDHAAHLIRGASTRANAKLDIIVEEEPDKKYTKISYEGSPEGMSELPEIIRSLPNE